MRTASKATLKKKLWKAFADYIKERDGWTCITCGKHATGAGMNAGHYIAKAACGLDYYFSERNVNAQCAYCNLAREGDRPRYRDAIIRRYGEDTLKDLEMNYHKPTRDFDYEGKIAHYQEALRALRASN